MTAALQASRGRFELSQGAVLTSHQDGAFSSESEVWIIISHDCDLAAKEELEPTVEVIVGVLLDEGKHNGSFITGRSHRTLHLEVQLNGKPRYVELRTINKKLIEKKTFETDTADSSYSIEEKSRRLLSSWLASRYRRHALPDALNDRLNRVYRGIEAVGKKKSTGVIATFLSFDPPGELESGDPYEVSMKVVYQHQEPQARANAEETVARIQAELQSNVTSENLYINEVTAVSDTEFTLYDQTQMIELKFEYLSFRGEEVGLTIE